MTKQFVEHNRKKYEIKEPTIKSWSELMNKKDLFESHEFYIKLIELSTGIPYEELKQAPADEVLETGDKVFRFTNQEQKKIFPTITHNNKTYQFIDTNDMSFGQYVDIDTFLNKDPQYRIQNLNELAAYFYIEQNTKYGDKPIKKRIKEFEELPIKYVEGAIFFLLSSARTSKQITEIYSKSRFLMMMINLKIISKLIGVGIQRLVHSVKKRFGSLTMCLAYPFISVLIICLTLWTYLRSGKNKSKKK